MGWLSIFRLVAFSVAFLSGIIAGPISAHVVAFTIENFNVYYNFAIMGLVSGGLTIITLPVMLIIDFLRTGAVTSWVLVELIWLSILWVLWLATGALTANDTSGVFVTCKFGNPILDQFCHETLSIEAFSFLAWIALFAYTTTLLIVALINASRGAPIWKSTVRQSGNVPAAPAAQSQEPTLQYNPNAFAPQSQSYPMQQQQQQPYGVPGQQWSLQQQQQQQPFATPQGQPPIQQYQPVPLHDTQHYTPPSQLQAQYITPQPAPSPAASNLSYQLPSSLSGRPPSKGLGLGG